MTARNDTSVDLATEAVSLGEGIYWVGKRPPNQIFYANPYLIADPANGERPAFSLLIDPGSGADFAVVRAKIEQAMGSLTHLDAVFINHQDPDVSASLNILLQPQTSHAHVLCSDETWQLIETLGIPRERYINVDDYPQGFRSQSGRTLVPVPSPFCHFVGARMLYCPRSRVLFSGDLFASLTPRDAEGLYADESDWIGMRAFHQIYMPTNRAIAMAIRKIRKLSPPVEIIAPQHGRLLRGAMVQTFLDRLETLDVGLDILDARDDRNLSLPAWQQVFERILEITEAVSGQSPIATLKSDRALANYLNFHRVPIALEHTGKKAVERVLSVLTRGIPDAQSEAIKYEALAAAHALQLPTPLIDFEEGSAARHAQQQQSPFEAV